MIFSNHQKELGNHYNPFKLKKEIKIKQRFNLTHTKIKNNNNN
jgi:hypothetical protein